MANLVLWADRFEKQRRLVLSAGMIACHGRVPREGEVIHVVTDVLEDLSDPLGGVGERDEVFAIVHGRGDGATHPAGRDPRTGPGAVPEMLTPRDIYMPGSAAPVRNQGAYAGISTNMAAVRFASNLGHSRARARYSITDIPKSLLVGATGDLGFSGLCPLFRNGHSPPGS